MKKENVKEENVEMEVVSNDTNQAMELFKGITKNMYCSKEVVTEQDKKDLFNALESCDVLLNDCVGNTLIIKDIYIEEKQVIDEETGELKTKYRTILFDEAGQTYATGSYGIYNVLRKIVQVYGLPTTWEKGLEVKVSKRPIGNGKQSLTLLIV